MPYILVTTQSGLENGPTVVGDEFSDTYLMETLRAKSTQTAGNTFEVPMLMLNIGKPMYRPLYRHRLFFADASVDIFKEWVVDQPPRMVLNELETMGYKVIGTTGIGQTAIWTLHKPI